MRILFTAHDQNDACNFYRGKGALVFAEGVDLHEPNTNITWSKIIGDDLGMILRPSSIAHLQFAKLIKMQMPLVVDWDDDIINLPLENPAYTHFNDDASKETMDAIMTLADRLIVSTDRLADVFATAYPGVRNKVRVIRNAFNPRIMLDGHKQQTEKIVLWRGSPSHIKDLADYANAIAQVSNRHRDWRFVFMGMQPWPLVGKMNFEYIPAMDIMQYYRYVGVELLPSIVMVPLSNNEFNKAKSNIAWIEATSFGAMTVAPVWSEWARPGIRQYLPGSGASFAGELDAAIEAFENGNSQGFVDESWEHIERCSMLDAANHERVKVFNEVL